MGEINYSSKLDHSGKNKKLPWKKSRDKQSKSILGKFNDEKAAQGDKTRV